MSAETHSDEPARLGRFELVRPLGEGGGSHVRLVRDPRHGGALRAMKLGPEEGPEGADRVLRLFHEARVLGALLHPGVPRLYEVGRLPDGTPWLLLEYVEPSESAPDPVQVAKGLLDVLAYLHGHGWLHHDLKPGNVVTTESGRVVLLDYGLASRREETVPPRGTLPYVAPEVLDAQPADPRSDLWSFGAVLLSHVLGEPLAPTSTLGPDDVAEGGPLPVEWLKCLLHPRPERRFDTAEVAYTELLTALGEPIRPLPLRPLPQAAVPVGRTSELEHLFRRMEAMRRTASQAADEAPTAPAVALLHGEPGVGKTHLLAELRLRALEAGWSVYLASCLEDVDAPLPAFGSLLVALLEDAPPDSPAVLRRGRAVASLHGARGDRDAPETAARFLLERAAEDRPILILIEDLQSASALTLRVLTTIGRVAAGARGQGHAPRLFVVATLAEGGVLPEEVVERLGALAAEGVLQRFPVRPLAGPDVTALVRSVLGEEAPAERISEIVRLHGGALPLFAKELLTRLVASRALRTEGGRWVLDERHAPRLPENLLTAVTSRLEALPVPTLRALQLLGTFGRPLPLSVAGRLLGADAEGIVTTLQGLGLAVPAREGRAIALAHAVIGRAALALLAPRSRARLHDRVAAGMTGHDRATEIRRAYHAARGTDVDASFAAATEAARRLRADGEHGRAADFVRQALRRLPEGDPRVPLIRRSLAELLVNSGRPEAAANVYRDLVEEEDDPQLRARLLTGLAEALDSSGLSARVAEHCHEALDALQSRRGDDADPESRALRLSILARLAGAERATGDLRGAIATVKKALPLAGDDHVGDRAALLSLLGNIYVQMGDLHRARQFHERCLATSRSLGSRRDVATAFHNLGVVHAHLGESAEAARSYRQSLRLSRRAKDLQGVALTIGNLANLRAEEGDFAGAEKLQGRSLALRRRIGDLAGVAVTQGNIAGLKRARGRLGSALALLQAAIKALRSLGDISGEVQFLLQAASIHLFAGDHQGAGPLLTRAVARAEAASLRGLEGRAELLWGRLERRRDPDGEHWSKHLARAQLMFEHVSDRAGLAEVHLERALGAHARGRRGVAMREWRAASGLLGEGSGADLRARVDLVRGLLESGRAPSPDALAALERFHEYARSSGRRDHRGTAAFALARARLGAGDLNGAAKALAEARQIEDDLSASLPPALRKARAASLARRLLTELAEELAQEQEDAGAAREADFDPMEQDRLLKLLEINKELNQAADMRALLARIMDIATEMTGAGRGFLILVEDGRIAFQTARNFRREEVRKPELQVSSSIVKRVMKSGAPILTDNATEDQRFTEFKSVDRLELKSIVSIPFRLGEEVIGALYLDNPARKGVFGPGDLSFLTALADQAALAIKNLRHASDMAALNRQLEKNLEEKTTRLEQASRALADRATKYPYDDIIGRSQSMRAMLLLVDKVVDTEVPVLIQGESGTGKELVAHAIHNYGRRKDGPFVAVNCGAIAATLMETELFGHAKGAFTGAVETKKGLFRVADGGTIFLDEIGEMDTNMQKKLLRVLQEREVRPVGGKEVEKVDVRVISATNRDLRQLMKENVFRQDLYYRIAVITVDLPPLRHHADDIPELVAHFVASAAKNLGLTAKPLDDEVMDALKNYDWPGNVRELDNEVKKALTLSDDVVLVSDLSPHLQDDQPSGPEPQLVQSSGGRTLKENLEKTEKALIARALDKTGGNQTQAAKALGISRVWLRKKMEKYGLLTKRS